MVDHHPVQTSAVYLLGAAASRPTVAPPSPPSPLTPSATVPGTPIDELCLNDAAAEVSGALDAAETARARERIAGAIHVLDTEATALRSLATLYEEDASVAAAFDAAVGAITRHGGARGKLVVVGVGKSGHIGRKLVASFNSLGVRAAFLHPTEALHGDLGEVGPHDTLLFITFSGRTPELLALLPHLDPALPALVLTAHTRPEACELVRQRPSLILLPAPIPRPEAATFGVSAPTTSTTAALALGDALALVAARELHAAAVPAVFARNHPGGAIGAACARPQDRVRDIAVPLAGIVPVPPPAAAAAPLLGADVLKAGYDSPTGWVRVDDHRVVSPGRLRRLDARDLVQPVARLPTLGARLDECVTIAADTRIAQATAWVRDMISSPDEGHDALSVLVVTDKDDIVGVLEASQLLG